MCGVRLFGLTPWFVCLMYAAAANTAYAVERSGLYFARPSKAGSQPPKAQ